MNDVPAKVGRPSSYSPELSAIVCRRIAEGESLRGICAEEDMPATSTIMRWISAVPGFREHYEQAIRERIELAVDDLAHLTEAPPERGPDGKIDPGYVALQRLRVETRRWIASRLLPKKYGDAVALAVKSETKHYVVHVPARTTNDPMEWARQVHAERVASGELPPDSPPPGYVEIK
jgi:hypothetical protein